MVDFSYDALNRVTSKTYANGDPAVSYTYDNTGAGDAVCLAEAFACKLSGLASPE